ncbi:HAD family hydrolase [Arthrobacter tumbae]|uniref:HAD hydrolase-like protein n=1 Tax=Arthrobacter tumbae TaxID=163874 RepID=UPI00195BD015|nr:HAD hydrolase-like protein [Arthrobacter tumbae]MBM7783050.1 phosphoglycolate phosphatase [Arthrobacter tumbae]
MKNTRLLVLFDLDGTLVDPEGAITGGIAGALSTLGLPVPGPVDMRRMVGPALVRSLVDIAKVPEDRVAEVISLYRAGYRAHGMAESKPYPGIAEAVQALTERGHLIAVATQKPGRLARELLDVQGMTSLFASIHGSPDDEQAAALLDGKRTIIAQALARHQGSFDRALMVGDRVHDIEGAAANGLDCIAVAWGFGSEREFESGGPAGVVSTAESLLEHILAYAEPSRAVTRGRL